MTKLRAVELGARSGLVSGQFNDKQPIEVGHTQHLLPTCGSFLEGHDVVPLLEQWTDLLFSNLAERVVLESVNVRDMDQP